MKKYLIFFTLYSLLTNPIYAILDQDNDGMSDLWETSYGFSNTSSNLPGQGPTQDPDGDGISNLLESVAGTNPLSSIPPYGSHRISVAPNVANPLSLDLQWQQFIGKQYQVFSSTDLTPASWTPLTASFTAATANYALFTTPSRVAGMPKNFQRVSVNDIDPDGDGLSNSEEYTLGTNPNLADSDGDGTLDKNEVIQGSSPTNAGDGGQAPPVPVLLPIKLRIYTSASIDNTNYVNGGLNGLLTPYRIKIYRQNIATAVETLVHTTADYGGTMFALNEVVQLPNISNDPNQRYTAQIDLPIIGTGEFDLPYRQWSFFLNISPADNTGAPFIGISGFEPINQTFGVVASNMLRSFNIYDPLYKNYRAVIASVGVDWKPILGFDNISAHVDPWSSQIKGTKIFPDYKNPLDTVIRHKLEVVVKTDASMIGQVVYVKAFDVDDSTLETFDMIDGPAIIDTNGKSGNDNLQDYLDTTQSGQFWTGAGWDADIAQGLVDQNGEAKFIFRVGMQPGNNYRVVASLVEPSLYTGVQVTNSTAAKYLGPEAAQTGGAPATPLLTVWRRLWVENDSMAAIPVDTFGYERNDLSSDLSPATLLNVYLTSAGANTSFAISGINDQSSFLNLENGKIIVQSISYPVINTNSFEVTISGNHALIPINSEFRLYDDDDIGLDVAPLPRLDLVNAQMKNYYKTAYIDVVDSGNFNSDKQIPFLRNEDMSSIFTSLDDKKNLTDRNELWVALISTAYQGPYDADRDPVTIGDESLRDGESGAHGGVEHSTIYVECCRETFNGSLIGVNPATARVNLRKWTVAAASHEIGHLPGVQSEADDHSEARLMYEGLGGVNALAAENAIFSPATLKRFRKANRWAE